MEIPRKKFTVAQENKEEETVIKTEEFFSFLSFLQQIQVSLVDYAYQREKEVLMPQRCFVRQQFCV